MLTGNSQVLGHESHWSIKHNSLTLCSVYFMVAWRNQRLTLCFFSSSTPPPEEHLRNLSMFSFSPVPDAASDILRTYKHTFPASWLSFPPKAPLSNISSCNWRVRYWKKNRSSTCFVIMLHSFKASCSTGCSIKIFHACLKIKAYPFFFFQIITNSNNQCKTDVVSLSCPRYSFPIATISTIFWRQQNWSIPQGAQPTGQSSS